MIDLVDVPLKVRARVETLTVLTVTANFSATVDGYARAAGSFLADGFEIGQEITPSGFSNAANNEVKVITEVSALTLKTAGYKLTNGNRTLLSTAGTAVEAEGSRTIAVKIPVSLEAEGLKLVTAQGIPWWREEWSPSPGGGVKGIGNSGVEIETFIDYFITIFVPTGAGRRAGAAYQTALLRHFRPAHVIPVADSATSVRVRSEVVPRPGQMFEAPKPHEGFLVVPVVVPLYVWSPNS